MILSGTGMLRKHGRMRIILWRSFHYRSDGGVWRGWLGNVHTAACVAADELLGINMQP